MSSAAMHSRQEVWSVYLAASYAGLPGSVPGAVEWGDGGGRGVVVVGMMWMVENGEGTWMAIATMFFCCS